MLTQITVRFTINQPINKSADKQRGRERERYLETGKMVYVIATNLPLRAQEGQGQSHCSGASFLNEETVTSRGSYR